MLGGLGLEVIDSEKAGGYSPLDFPPFGRFVLGFLETGRERGSRSVCRILVEESTRPRRSIKCARAESGKTMAVKPAAGGSR
jgi:hypothetical protein